MTNLITIELCAEDRVRLDRLTAALEQRVTQVDSYLTEMDSTLEPTQQRLTATIEAEEEATEAEEETPVPTTTTPTEETPTEEKKEPQKPTITKELIKQKVNQLCASSEDKLKVREIIFTYAPSVSDLPEDKLGEVWDKLTALESEV